MEKDLKLAVGTISRSLATFIKQELGGTNIAVHLLTEPETFLKQIKNLQPDIILLDVDYPTKEEAAGLVARLQQQSSRPPVPLVLIKPFFDELEKELAAVPAERVLPQPFTRDDLLTMLRQVTPREIVSEPAAEDDLPAPPAAELLLTGEEAPVIELTEVVEEGLPLSELPPLATNTETDADEAPAATAAVDETAAASPAAPGNGVAAAEATVDFPDEAAIAGLELPTPEEGEAASTAEEDTAAPAAGEFSPAATAAVPETEPPAAEMITPDLAAIIPDEGAVEESTAPAAAPDGEETPLPAVEAAVQDADGKAAMADTIPEADAPAATPAAPESPADYLLPEEREPAAAEPEPAAGQRQEEPTAPAAAPAPEPAATDAASRQPAVVTEPDEAPFADQVEKLTQEWSQKMLASTFASMDKLIQALGEMAPTIVEQVAKEIIPPLAEKIIKAEIKRLEEKVEEEENQ
ncbi:MAG: hypothetical protein JRJ56_07790 [Deltaproteobacteria bacterium]|nr:hypothetical protein [Deltaproteobacteria bacterium]